MLARLLRLVVAVGLIWGTVVLASALAPASVSRRIETVHGRIASRIPPRLARAHDKIVARLERLKDRLFD